MPSEPSRSGMEEPGRRRPSRAAHSAALLAAMLAVWLLLSGYFGVFLLTLGAMSCVIVVALALRMDVVDRESFPIHLTSKVLTYWPWLLKEIWLAAVDVTKRVLSPSLPISPTVVDLEATQQSDLGKVIYANSITLTPGTFTIRIHDDRILVHALSREGAESLAGGDMDRRVSALEAG